jgi:hypothetical protein
MAAQRQNAVPEERLYYEWCPFWAMDAAPELYRPNIACHNCDMRFQVCGAASSNHGTCPVAESSIRRCAQLMVAVSLVVRGVHVRFRLQTGLTEAEVESEILFRVLVNCPSSIFIRGDTKFLG